VCVVLESQNLPKQSLKKCLTTPRKGVIVEQEHYQPILSKAAPQPDAPTQLRLIKKSPPSSSQSDKIRAELNIEKWPALWRPACSKSKPTVRILERETKDREGNITNSRVEVGFTHLGMLTTEEQKMFYALVKQWEDSGKPDSQVFFSDRLLQRLLKKKWGTNVIESITKALRKLRATPIEWTNAYRSKTEEGVVLKHRRMFNILSELRIVEREVDGSTNKALGYFKFDDAILHNLLHNYTKPLLLDTIIGINNAIAQLLYVHVDLMLARRDFYERRSKELFQDLGLNNPEYERQYGRKRALEMSLPELAGIPLSTGILTVARIEKTNDKLDYKVIFQKASYSAAAVAGERTSEEEPSSDVVIHDYSKPRDPTVAQAEELVQYFHKVFHRVDDSQPASKEIAQALTLITQHGLEHSKHVVEFARAASERTNFKIQHFGGVLSYASRALADLERQQRSREESKKVIQRQTEEAQEEEQRRIRGEQRLTALTPEQYQERYEKSKEQMFKQYPFLSGKWEDSIHEGAIRAQMIRTLEEEQL
jgi:hypothetical protein